MDSHHLDFIGPRIKLVCMILASTYVLHKELKCISHIFQYGIETVTWKYNIQISPIVITLKTPLCRESMSMNVDPIFFSRLNEMDSRRHN